MDHSTFGPLLRLDKFEGIKTNTVSSHECVTTLIHNFIVKEVRHFITSHGNILPNELLRQRSVRHLVIQLDDAELVQILKQIGFYKVNLYNIVLFPNFIYNNCPSFQFIINVITSNV